nr:MAG TPA: hypothetical protein [Caudoviricetes sp.]
MLIALKIDYRVLSRSRAISAGDNRLSKIFPKNFSINVFKLLTMPNYYGIMSMQSGKRTPTQ